MSYISPEMLVEQFKMSAQKFPSAMSVEGAKGADGKLNESLVKNAIDGYAASLYPKYKEHVQDMKESSVKRLTVIMMENWSRATKYMEATVASNIANFDKYAFPLIRAILPEIATEQFFTVQPMLGPTAPIFTLSPVYGKTIPGKVNAGDALWQNLDRNYGDSEIDAEDIGTGNGSSTTVGTGFIPHTPIVPGTLNITDGSQILSDDGAGNLTGDGTGTINYSTGQLSITWTTAPASGDPVEASYSVDNETNIDGIPEIDLVLTSTTVTARRKALRVRWSLTAAFALRDVHGVDGEAELVQAAATEIAYGIDAQNFANVTKVAMNKTADASFQYNNIPGAGISYTEHKVTLIDYLIKGSSYILKQSGRVVGNVVLMSERVTNVLESIGAPRFVPSPSKASRGIQLIGTLDNRWQIFRTIDPQYVGLNETTTGSGQYSEYLMGAKQPDFLHAGYVWAPWIAAFETPTTILDDFQGRKGVASLYGQKVINAKYYLKLKAIFS